MYEVKVFISGMTPKTIDALEYLKANIREIAGDSFSLKIINVLDNLDEAEKNRILATPTLIKTSPGEAKRIIGDLHLSREVLMKIFKNS